MIWFILPAHRASHIIKYIIISLLNDVVTWNVDPDHAISLLQAMRSTDYTALFISWRSAVIGAFRSSHCYTVPASSCSLSSLLLYCFPVAVFFYRGHPWFRNFNSTFPVDVTTVKSYVGSFLDPTCVAVRNSVNKLDLVPNLIVASTSTCIILYSHCTKQVS